jgi:hypothetical protein
MASVLLGETTLKLMSVEDLAREVPRVGAVGAVEA